MEELEDINIQASPEETSPMERLEDIIIPPFIGIADTRRMVKWQSEKLQKGDLDQQYLVFARVGIDDLAKIDLARNGIGKHIRMTHYTDTDLLIVKLPSATREAAHLNLVAILYEELVLMGVRAPELCGLGGTRFYGRSSSKEGDSTYKPLSQQRETD